MSTHHPDDIEPDVDRPRASTAGDHHRIDWATVVAVIFALIVVVIVVLLFLSDAA